MRRNPFQIPLECKSSAKQKIMDRIKVWIIPGIIVLLSIGALIYFRGKLPESAGPAVQVKTEVEVNRPKGFAKPPDPSAQKKEEEDGRPQTGESQFRAGVSSGSCTCHMRRVVSGLNAWVLTRAA